ncbi:MAG: hypothetical protein RIG63_09755 [Coleofasciculus chthonoplastes F3-SA18-01]|uniref:hypothetical protein n=1 Tax=Coleofasciculus chthonoplastes TaxID=64178 RepID=UPI00330294F4
MANAHNPNPFVEIILNPATQRVTENAPLPTISVQCFGQASCEHHVSDTYDCLTQLQHHAYLIFDAWA